MRDIEPKSVDISTYEFIVVCNYTKEVLQFTNFIPNLSNDKINIQIQKGNSEY